VIVGAIEVEASKLDIADADSRRYDLRLKTGGEDAGERKLDK